MYTKWCNEIWWCYKIFIICEMCIVNMYYGYRIDSIDLKVLDSKN